MSSPTRSRPELPAGAVPAGPARLGCAAAAGPGYQPPPGYSPAPQYSGPPAGYGAPPPSGRAW